MEWLFVILMTTIALYRNLKVRDIHMIYHRSNIAECILNAFHAEQTVLEK